jgi:hypothetical protein
MTPADQTLHNLGGRRFIAMTGAHSLLVVDRDTLQFKLPRFSGVKINCVRITLNWRDLYDVEFGRVAKSQGVPTYVMLSRSENVFCEDLVQVFESATGLATRL